MEKEEIVALVLEINDAMANFISASIASVLGTTKEKRDEITKGYMDMWREILKGHIENRK